MWQNVFAVSSDILKHLFHDLHKVLFWAGQEAENEFSVPTDHLKQRFLERTKVVFYAGQEVDN